LNFLNEAGCSRPPITQFLSQKVQPVSAGEQAARGNYESKSCNVIGYCGHDRWFVWCPTCLAVLEATHGQNHQLRASKESGQGGTADTGPVSREYVVDRWECFCEIKATDCGNREAITIVPHDSRPDARQELKPRRRRLLSRSLVRPKRAPKGELMSTA
jgi:hypothetical protein